MAGTMLVLPTTTLLGYEVGVLYLNWTTADIVTSILSHQLQYIKI